MNIQTSRHWLLGIASVALVGCGGSDSVQTVPAPTPTPAPTPAPTPTPALITVSGTAVKGAALGGAAIAVKCATGTAATTSAANGTYTTTLSNAALPCVVRAVGTDGTTYHSLIAGGGSTGTFTANLSPLTEMVVSHVSGTAPASLYNDFRSTAEIPEIYVTAANSYVASAMAGLTDLAGVNSLTDPLVVGNALDQKIDAVVAGLAAAGLTVAEVTMSIIANPSAPNVVATPLATAATACAWLKSGKYRLIDRMEIDPTFRFQVVQINAATLMTTFTDLGGGALAPMTSDGSCQFNINETDTNTTLKVLISSGGMMVIHGQSNAVASQRAVILGVPEQTLPISEFAGTWNLATWQPVNFGTAGSIVAEMDEVTLDATGQITATKGCLGLAACVSGTAPFAKFVANAAGGFDVVEGGATIGRIFLYKTLAGKKVAVMLDIENSLVIAVPKISLGALPAVGLVSNFRNLELGANNSVSALTENSNTVTAVDSVANSFTRIQTSNNRVDSVTLDKPRDGLRYRAPNSCTINGVVNNCAEWVQLPLQGMGITMTLSAVTEPTAPFYQFSIGKP